MAFYINKGMAYDKENIFNSCDYIFLTDCLSQG